MGDSLIQATTFCFPISVGLFSALEHLIFLSVVAAQIPPCPLPWLCPLIPGDHPFRWLWVSITPLMVGSNSSIFTVMITCLPLTCQLACWGHSSSSGSLAWNFMTLLLCSHGQFVSDPPVPELQGSGWHFSSLNLLPPLQNLETLPHCASGMGACPPFSHPWAIN